MKRTSQYPTDSFFKGIKTLLKSLPSEKEKKELVKILSETQAFVNDLQVLIETIPTTESSRCLSQGLSRLDILADRADKNTRLRRLMGLRGSQSPKVKNVKGSEDTKSRATRLEQRINITDSSGIINVIEQSREPVIVLTALAASLGLRTRKKERKAELVERIATRITNQRGYRLLGGDDANPTSPSIDNHAASKQD